MYLDLVNRNGNLSFSSLKFDSFERFAQVLVLCEFPRAKGDFRTGTHNRGPLKIEFNIGPTLIGSAFRG
jgi:hypothetical protein